jgi:hypothetical protein
MGGAAFLGVHVSLPHIAHNRGVILDMLALRGNAIKDWAKLALAFGGLWWIVPWLIRGQPRFVRRCLLVALPAIAGAASRAILDEVRVYGELIPVVLTPVVYFVAEKLNGTIRENGTPRLPPA